MATSNIIRLYFPYCKVVFVTFYNFVQDVKMHYVNSAHCPK